jgi:peptide-methionine (S)-S-oxide reductase
MNLLVQNAFRSVLMVLFCGYLTTNTVFAKENSMDTLVVGGGCFWCVEAVFERLPGVVDVQNGYAGGAEENPTYQMVSSGQTGHAEVVQIVFDPAQIHVSELLEWFFKSHNPTTINRQGADVGPQYRSIILYNSTSQKQAALNAVQKAQKNISEPIVTSIEPLVRYYPAEPYHQDYFQNNPNQAYCSMVIAPKLKKLNLVE